MIPLVVDAAATRPDRCTLPTVCSPLYAAFALVDSVAIDDDALPLIAYGRGCCTPSLAIGSVSSAAIAAVTVPLTGTEASLPR